MDIVKSDIKSNSNLENRIDTSDSYTRAGFLRALGHKIYHDIDRRDIHAMYQRAYEVFDHNNKGIVRIEPVPQPFSEIKDYDELKFFEQLFFLEWKLSIQYFSGFAAISGALGRDVFEDIKTLERETKFPDSNI
jgi:hypothetical protein